jgi:hypothetical protein
VEWRKTLKTTLSKSCVALKTDPILKSILLNGMKCWLQQCWLQQVQFDDGGIPFQYHALLQDQQDISWYNSFLAQFATQWAQCQSLFLQTLPTPIKGLSGNKWVSAICTVITKAWLKLWELYSQIRSPPQSGCLRNHHSLLLPKHRSAKRPIYFHPGPPQIISRQYQPHPTVDQHTSSSDLKESKSCQNQCRS